MAARILRPDHGIVAKSHGCRTVGEVVISRKLSRRRFRRRAEGRSDFGTSRPAEAPPGGEPKAVEQNRNWCHVTVILGVIATPTATR